MSWIKNTKELPAKTDYYVCKYLSKPKKRVFLYDKELNTWTTEDQLVVAKPKQIHWFREDGKTYEDGVQEALEILYIQATPSEEVNDIIKRIKQLIK